MKLLFVSTGRDQAGGAHSFVELARAMAEMGHDVEALADQHSYSAQALGEAGVAWSHGRFRNVLTPAAHRALRDAIRRIQPDWLLSGSSGKEFWPLIAHGRMHNVPVALFRRSGRPMKRGSGYFLPRLADRFFAVSHYCRDLFIQRGMPADCVQMLYSPVDMAKCRPDLALGQTLRQSLDVPGDAIVVGNVGRIHAGKGIFHLQEALESAMDAEPRLHALWVGEGEGLAELRERVQASAHTDRHHITGWRTDAWRYYNAMSMLAFPTLLQEASGRTSIEAQACSVPVLGSDTCGVPETLRNGETGLLLPRGDVGAWRDGILELCNDEKRQRMSSAARPFIQQTFSSPVVAQTLTRILAGDQS